jgi:hypothetical protein
MMCVGNVARTGDIRGPYRTSVRETEGKKPLGRPKCGEKVNAKVCRKETGYEDVEWFQLTEDRVQWRARVYTIMNLRAP